MKKIVVAVIGGVFVAFAVIAAPRTLWEFYTTRGLSLPTVTQRHPMADLCGIPNYAGTAEQNTQLLVCLTGTPIGPFTLRQRELLFGSGVGTPVTNYSTTLTTPLTSATTSLAVATTKTFDGHQLVDADIAPAAYLVINASGSTMEIVKCTGVSSTHWAGCTRGLVFYGRSEAAVTANQKAHASAESVEISDVHFYAFSTNVPYTVEADWTFASSTASTTLYLEGTNGQYPGRIVFGPATATFPWFGKIGADLTPTTSDKIGFSNNGTDIIDLANIINGGLTGGSGTSISGSQINVNLFSTSTPAGALRFGGASGSEIGLNNTTTAGCIDSDSKGIFVDTASTTCEWDFRGTFKLDGLNFDDATSTTAATEKLVKASTTAAVIDPGWIFESLVYGNGRDGATTISVNTTSTQDKYYASLTVNSDITLHTNGYRIFVQNTLTNNGNINMDGRPGGNGVDGTNGGDGAGGAAGAALNSASVCGGTAGVAGGSGGAPTAGTAGTARSSALGVNGVAGGAGGAGSAQAGGAGGSAGTATAPTSTPSSIIDTIPFRDWGTANGTIYYSSAGSGSGGSGGDGSNNGSAGGGGSGSTGGCSFIAARTLTNNGTISVRGGRGGNGGNGNGGGVNGGGGGGGSGGSGGIIMLIYHTITAGTLDVTGGPAGSGGTAGGGTGSAGSAGSAGTDGTVYRLWW